MPENKQQLIFQCKWYDTKEKAYTDCFVRNMQTAMMKANEAFDQGSKYFTINLIDII